MKSFRAAKSFAVLLLAVCCSLPVVICAAPQPGGGLQIDQSTKEYLEGAWLIGERPEKGDCTSYGYTSDQVEFEFRKSGGRMLIYRPFDLFTGIAIHSAERTGENLTLTLADLHSGPVDSLRIRILPPNRLELLTSETKGDEASSDPSHIAYRCGVADPSVTKAVSVDMLEVLTSPTTGTTLFVESPPGTEGGGTCGEWDAARRKQVRWLQFEVIGPVHFYVVGGGFNGKFDLQPIRSIRTIDNHTAAIEVLASQPGAPLAWDVGSFARPFNLTAEWNGSTLQIPELDAIFVRCIGSPKDGYAPAPLPIGGFPHSDPRTN